MGRTLIEIMKKNPIIAAVKSEEGLQNALSSKCAIIFVLYGNILNLPSIVTRIHQADKIAIVHFDLIEGASGKEIVVDFVKNAARADGIISAKAAILKAAKNRRLFTIHRFFLIDSMSFNSLPKQYANSQADVIEIMPGCIIPKVLKWVGDMMRLPMIASGLVCESEEARTALKAGAVAISTSSPEVWEEMNSGQGPPPMPRQRPV
ncbi:glycerol-3-phosphate responsive antiterminator [Deltaproteobacteria bacterium Smac51]|nr:glycerol-3-phosphate responsive antiterminator [Deltaproteobacteria bacterium Smac51]